MAHATLEKRTTIIRRNEYMDAPGLLIFPKYLA
jgi:hypothetical protein